jgi:hypothetical protein
MQKKMVWLLFVAIVLIAVLIPLVNYLQPKLCLDGGGHWNYDKRQCEGAR